MPHHGRGTVARTHPAASLRRPELAVNDDPQPVESTPWTVSFQTAAPSSLQPLPSAMPIARSSGGAPEPARYVPREADWADYREWTNWVDRLDSLRDEDAQHGE